MDTHEFVGTAFIIGSALGFVLNSLTVWSILTQRKLKQIHSAVYILFLQPIITDIVFELIYICYYARQYSRIALTQRNRTHQAPLIASPLGRYVSAVIDIVQSHCYYNNMLSQISLAVNRFVVLVQLRFFTAKRAILLSIVQHLLALAITIGHKFVLPCCRLEFSYELFGYRAVTIPGVRDYASAYLTLPVKIACAAVPLILYCSIFLTVRSIALKLETQSFERRRRRQQELRFATQFAVIALIFIFAAFAFPVLRLGNGTSNVKWIQALPVMLALLNCTSNAVVFLLNEKRKRCFIVCIPSS
ncbi:hypothetical protein PRIPAC_96801 [Pristionchus pacificus]|uniref:G protein-coupled receptor n=1 Tax=Pristionchus pacificus TaxID=54126 RepID=A0A2A6D1Q7_PRIPA|nr:hypothetical protein PRIPAC_96801 [Pristionchus pacificus]|eukprot:PDM84308.1 G protein-coupled receptor [Pristionchus pacificus]